VSASPFAGLNNELLFQWEQGRPRKLAIAGFLVASAALHALCFYIFQVIYPPTVALLPPPARVNLLVPTSDEGRTLLNWVNAEDPARASQTQRAPDSKTLALPKLNHIPSYLTTAPTLKAPPPTTPDLRVPSPFLPAPVPTRQNQSITPSPAAPTVVTFSDELQNVPVQKSDFKFRGSTNEPPQTAQYLVAVSSAGEIRYCFLQDSSGDPALDDQAHHYLLLCRFTLEKNTSANKQENLIWGRATIQFGNDVALPASPEEHGP